MEKYISHSSNFSILPLSSSKAAKEAPSNFPQKKNKGFLNYVFCRNWGVRNPAGSRLDSSSLVNKQVEVGGVYATFGTCPRGSWVFFLTASLTESEVAYWGQRQTSLEESTVLRE